MHLLHRSMVAPETGNGNDVIVIPHMTLQKFLVYIEVYLISDVHIVHIYINYFKSEIMALVHRFMGKLWCTVIGRGQTT